MIKKIFLILTLILLTLSLTPSADTQASYEAYYFDNYNVDVVVDENYIFHITEKIDTIFTEERHGIYRHLPKFWGEEKIKYTDISVEGAPFIVEKETFSTSIRIGDPDKTIVGDIQYIISYTVQLPKDPSKELDAVYINLLGNDNPTEVYGGKMTIHLPKKVDPSKISVFSGYYNDIEYGVDDKVKYEYIDRQVLYIELVSALDPYEGVTVKINLPQGYFTNVRNPFFFGELVKFLVPILLLALGIFFWKKHGDDDKIIMPVEVSPPDVSPIEAGYIIDGIINDEDISAMIIYWASLGFIKIEKVKGKGEYKFKGIKPITGRPEYEANIFNSIFPKKERGTIVTTYTLKSRLGSKISSFKANVKAKYERAGNKMIDKKSKRFSRINTLIAYITFALLGFFMGLNECVGLGLFLAGISMIFFSPIHIWLSRILQHISKRTIINTTLRLIPFMLLIALYVYLADVFIKSWWLSLAQIAVILVSACALIVIAFYTQKLSEQGHTLYERVLGFRHFLLTAEKDWLEELAKDTPEYYYSMLPYALVLGVSNVWIGKFAETIQSPPDWYTTEGTDSNFRTRSFSSGMVSDFAKIGAKSSKFTYNSGGYSSSSRSSSSYSYRPSSSSSYSSSFSSSSGSSGGGFGGGGSSSW